MAAGSLSSKTTQRGGRKNSGEVDMAVDWDVDIHVYVLYCLPLRVPHTDHYTRRRLLAAGKRDMLSVSCRGATDELADVERMDGYAEPDAAASPQSLAARQIQPNVDFQIRIIYIGPLFALRESHQPGTAPRRVAIPSGRALVCRVIRARAQRNGKHLFPLPIILRAGCGCTLNHAISCGAEPTSIALRSTDCRLDFPVHGGQSFLYRPPQAPSLFGAQTFSRLFPIS